MAAQVTYRAWDVGVRFIRITKLAASGLITTCVGLRIEALANGDRVYPRDCRGGGLRIGCIQLQVTSESAGLRDSQ